jgi:signal transduction histidine kinase
MLKGRLGLDDTRVPQKSRNGLVYVERARMAIDTGSLANGGDYEPTLAAATKNLGDRVEIRIRDNGTGMVPEVKEKLFSPFFTTKPCR